MSIAVLCLCRLQLQPDPIIHMAHGSEDSISGRAFTKASDVERTVTCARLEQDLEHIKRRRLCKAAAPVQRFVTLPGCRWICN